MQDLLSANYPYECLSRASVPTIYAAIDVLRERDGGLPRLAFFIRHLLNERGVEPTVGLYETLVAANASRSGSADAVLDLLEGMEAHGIAPSPPLLRAVLRVLVNHPDYLLRDNTMRLMRDHWVEIRGRVAEDLLLALLRDDEYELAVDRLETLYVRQGERPSPYVLEIFVYRLVDAGFYDEALRIFHYRLRTASSGQRGHGNHGIGGADHPSRAQWYYLLERASTDYEYDCVKYVWTRQVVKKGSRGSINPPDGVVENVLNTAGRRGDVAMALEAMEFLTRRGTRLRMHHYETLIETYIVAGELENAISTLVIMEHSAGIVPGRTTTRPILQFILAQPELLENAVSWLLRPQILENGLHADGKTTVYKPSVAALTVALEAVARLRGMDGPDGALTLLRNALVNAERQEWWLYDLQDKQKKDDISCSVKQDNIATSYFHSSVSTAAAAAEPFNALLRECQTVEAIKHIEGLMRTADVAVTAETLDMLVMIYAEHGDYADAKRWANYVLGNRENCYQISHHSSAKDCSTKEKGAVPAADRSVSSCNQVPISNDAIMAFIRRAADEQDGLAAHHAVLYCHKHNISVHPALETRVLYVLHQGEEKENTIKMSTPTPGTTKIQTETVQDDILDS